jgi:translation initiation factor IF-1
VAHKDVTIHEGTVTESLPNTMYRVKLDEGDREILAVVSGKLRHFFIKIIPGDRVKLELTPYDPNRGRIIYRYK